MWILLAFGSALFAGLTAVLAKIGIKGVDSNLATAIRTGIVLVFAWGIVLLGGAPDLSAISARSYLFLALSGLATGASWMCYFRALQLGDVNQVAPIDKSSTVLTMLLAFLLLGEPITLNMGIGMAALLLGTYLMISPKRGGVEEGSKRWLIPAILSAVFASLTAILAKVGVEEVDSNLATALRTGVVLVMAWILVFAGGKQREIRAIDQKSWLFLVLSALATGLSWLCYYRAIQQGLVSVVVPIDKLSIVVSVLFARVFLHEKLGKRALAGFAILILGTVVLLFPF